MTDALAHATGATVDATDKVFCRRVLPRECVCVCTCVFANSLRGHARACGFRYLVRCALV
jgi:hypothetical protein